MSPRPRLKRALVSLLVLHAVWLPACCNVERIRTESLPDGVVGQPYSFEIEHNCSDESTLRTEGTGWQVSGDLPPGIELENWRLPGTNGRLFGTPTVPGRFSFVVSLSKFTDVNPEVVLESKTFSLLVRPPA